MLLTVHNFPPTIWQLQDWSFGPFTLMWIVVLVGATLLSLQWSSTGLACSFWCFAGTIVSPIFALSLLWISDIYSRSTRLVDIAIFGGIVVVVMIATLRTTLAHAKKHERTGIVMMTGTVTGLAALGMLMMPVNDGHPIARARTHCKNNLKYIGLAMHNFHDVHGHMPGARFSRPRRHSTEPDVSWRVTLLPYLDQQELYEQYNDENAWDSNANSQLTKMRIQEYHCPQRPRGRERNTIGQFLTSYVVPTGPQTIFEGDGPGSAIRSMTDGTSNTLMVLEACGTSIVWTEPRDVDVEINPISVNASSERIDHSDSTMSSYHRSGTQVLLADGSARFVSEHTDPAVLSALLTKAGGEIIGEW